MAAEVVAALIKIAAPGVTLAVLLGDLRVVVAHALPVLCFGDFSPFLC